MKLKTAPLKSDLDWKKKMNELTNFEKINNEKINNIIIIIIIVRDRE